MAVLSLDATKAFLNKLDRWSLSVGGGATEVGWTNEKGENVALGWFSPTKASVGVDQSSSVYPGIQFDFAGADADALRYCGKSSRHTENSAPLPPLPDEAAEEDDEPAGAVQAAGEITADEPGEATAPAARDYLVIGIVDDDAMLASTFAYWAPALFDGEHLVLQATTIDTAVTLLEAAAPETVDVILVDGYIPFVPSDGRVVMAMLRHAGYSGPMVAISSDDRVRTEMVAAGCVAECSKHEPKQLEQVIRGLLDRPA